VKSILEKDLDDRLSYVRIRDFQERTAADLANVLAGLNEKNFQGLVLDLRNNPGGLLTSAIDVSELFLPKGKLIVYTQGRSEEDKSVFNSKRNALWDRPIVLLMNQGSASASEILIGALKNNLKTTAVGMKTFGKGSVQNLIPLKDGSAIKLTIAHYYTPSGVCIEGKGIEPDVKVELPKVDSEEQLFIPGEAGDIQFQKAVEILKQLVKK